MGGVDRPEALLRRLGVLGGTFDPPHYGHLALAEAALAQLTLERVLFVPTGDPPHRPVGALSSALHREAMLSLAIAGHEHFTLSRADLDRPGPHYTSDLLAILRRSHPNHLLYFLVGEDGLAHLAGWRDPERILAQAQLAVLPRPGWHADLDELERTVAGIRGRAVWLDGPALPISASDIRRRVCEGRSIAECVPPSVADYIRRQCLYRG